MDVAGIVVKAAIVADRLVAEGADCLRDTSRSCAVGMEARFGARSEFCAWC